MQLRIQVSAHVRRIEAVEKELKALSESSATKEDISRVRGEMKKLYDGLHVGEFVFGRKVCETLSALGQDSLICGHMYGESVSV